MRIDLGIESYQKWLEENITLSNPFSESALRRFTEHVLMGGNYRLFTELHTKGKLFATYVWLTDIQERARKEYGQDWIKELFDELYSQKRKPAELRNLLVWLMGLTHKTAVNNGITTKDYPEVIGKTLDYLAELFGRIQKDAYRDRAWLLLMAGSATLSLRGSEKSRIGKHFERVLLRAIMAILGLTEDTNFWMNIGRDIEVEREADAEIETKRGRIRVEVGLIAQGNQEVIEDKIARVGRNGIVIFDKLRALSWSRSGTASH